MQEVKIIYVDSLTDLEPEREFIVLDTTEDKIYIGNGTTIPKEIYTSGSPIYANNFLLMGA